MKVKVISRAHAQYTRGTKNDLHPLPTNVDPSLHPMEAPREYCRQDVFIDIDFFLMLLKAANGSIHSRFEN